MGQTRTKRTADQRLAFEHKVGAGLIAGLLGIFLFILSARLGGFGWGDQTVEVNLGGATTAAADGSGFTPPSARRETAQNTASREPFAPPQVYLPPAPPPVVAAYPLAKPAAVPAATKIVAPVTPPPADASQQMAKPGPTPSNPSVGDRYATLTIAPPTAPAKAVATADVVHATPPARENSVPTIGLVTGTAPVAPSNHPAGPTTGPAAAQVHVFAAGDNYWTIAQKAYGDGAYYRALFAYNQDRYPHPEDLRPGDKVDVPSLAELRSKFPQLCTPSSVAGGR